MLVPPIVGAAIEDNVAQHGCFTLEAALLEDGEGLGHDAALLERKALRRDQQRDQREDDEGQRCPRDPQDTAAESASRC
jgi:hypothetical protein